jgi:hypothetical protein
MGEIQLLKYLFEKVEKIYFTEKDFLFSSRININVKLKCNCLHGEILGLQP